MKATTPSATSKEWTRTVTDIAPDSVSFSSPENLYSKGRQMKYIFKKTAAVLRKREKGQTISEAIMCMLILCLIFFGLLQIFYISVAQMITDYSAFTAARCRAVGFADYLVHRNARVAAIGASGAITYPEGDAMTYSNSPLQQFGAESIRIPEYISGERWLDYEYWRGDNDEGTYLGVGISNGINTVRATSQFHSYPLDFPMRAAFTNSETVDISGNAQIMDYASYYLE